jgi:hypothetical protein
MLNPGQAVTVLPEWLQVEGADRVLDRLQSKSLGDLPRGRP